MITALNLCVLVFFELLRLVFLLTFWQPGLGESLLS